MYVAPNIMTGAYDFDDDGFVTPEDGVHFTKMTSTGPSGGRDEHRKQVFQQENSVLYQLLDGYQQYLLKKK